MTHSIQITTLHLEPSETLNEYVHKKFKRLERHFDHITHTHFTFSVDKKFQQSAKAIMHLAGGKDIIASCVSKDLYASIDMLIDKLDEQIKKHKEKLKEK